MGMPQQRERVTADGLGNIGVGKWKKTVENNAFETNSSSDNAVKKSQNKVSSPLVNKSVNKSVKKSSNTGINSVANSVEDDIIKDVKELSLSNLSEFEDWQAGYYKINNGVSFSREDNPTIYCYTGGDYDIISALERGGEQLDKVKRNYGEQYVESLKGSGDKISAELSKFKLNTPLRLKRSVGKVDYITGATSSVEDMQKMIGKTFTEKGFTSSTICMDEQLPFGGYNESTRITLEIIIPKDTKGAYVYKISDSPAEFEFLIDKNTTYKVIDAGEREISVKDYKGNESKKTERYMVLKVIKQ